MEKTGSFTYYATPDTHKGMLHTSTVYGVATQGTNKDQVTTYSYSYSEGTLTTTVTCEGKTTESCYDALGQLMWSEDEYGKKTDYDYDWRGRSTTTTYPLVTGESTRKTRVNDYGGCCYLTSVTDEEGNAVHYGYNTKGTMTKQWTDITGQSIETPLVEYDYSGVFGRLVNVTTRKSSTDTAVINYEYDDLGRVDKVNYQQDGMFAALGSEEYLYDEYGRLAAAKNGDGKITAYEYDYLDRVVKIDNNYPGTFTLPVEIPTSDPDGSIVSYTYDDSIVPTGRVATVTEVIDGQSVTSSYSYDDRERLISYTPALPAGYGSITYTWSLSGQKTSMTVPMGNNSAKRYSYYYDKEGRQVGMDVEAVSVTSSPTLTAGSSGSNTRFFYDNNENRVKLITKSGSAYYFVYDPTASIPAVVYEATGNTAYMNTREPSGALISREKYTGGVYQYGRTYHFDGLGSTIALTDEDGVTTDTYSYDAWGNVTHTSGTTADNPYQYVGELGYYTHYQEPTLNLLQLGVRFYDAEAGRFNQMDPIGDGLNWYGYVEGNPITGIDPYGLKSHRNYQCEDKCQDAMHPKTGISISPPLEKNEEFQNRYITKLYNNIQACQCYFLGGIKMEYGYLPSLEENLPRVPGSMQMLRTLELWDVEASPELWVDHIFALASSSCVSHVYLDPAPGKSCKISVCVDGTSLSVYQLSAKKQEHILVALTNKVASTGSELFLECVWHNEDHSFWISRVNTTIGPQVTICRLRKWDNSKAVWDEWPQKASSDFLKTLDHPNGLAVFCHRAWNTEFGPMAKVLYSMASERSRYYYITEGQMMVEPHDNVYHLKVDGTKASWDRTLGALNRENADVVAISGRDENETVRQALLTALQDRKVFTDLSVLDVLCALKRLSSGSIVDPTLLSEVLIGVFGVYRGLRCVCQECAVASEPDDMCMQSLNSRGITDLGDGNWVRSVGCERCNGTGFSPDYLKWFTVAESVYVDRDLARILATQPTIKTLQGALAERGFRTYLDYGLDYARQGLTTIQEATRVGLARRADL